MSANERVEQAAFEVIAGRRQVYDAEPGYCLKLVREIVQAGMGWNYDEFYSLLTYRVEGNETGPPWARSLQRSLRNLGNLVPWEEREGGDLVFNFRPARQGHVGVLVGRSLVLENTSTQRGILISGYNRLSPIEDWPYQAELEVMRLPWAPQT